MMNGPGQTSGFRYDRVIDLGPLEPVRTGDVRDIYQLAEYPHSLLKIIRAEKVGERGFFEGKHAIKNIRPEGCYQGFAREIREFLIQCRRLYPQSGFLLPFAHIHGMVQTTSGLGLLSEKIVGSDGMLAPTIAKLHASGELRDTHRDALKAMFQRCRDLHVVLNDIHASNVVYTEERSGKPECVCVDGFGERVLVPIHRWSKRVNDRKISSIEQGAAEELAGMAAVQRWGDKR